jgi:hypothetical protein
MSLRSAVEIEDETKLRTENKTIGTVSTHVHHRRIRMSGLTRLLDEALKLSAVIGFNFAASVERAASKFAAPG